MGDAIVKQMPQAVAAVAQWTPEQKDLIKRTVAKDCTDDELAMFLHVAAKAGLDPLLKQIHCLKVGGRLAFIADINGLQARAARESDYEGIDHAVVYEKDTFSVDQKSGDILEHVSNPFANGRPIGAWAVVHRRGMKPFRSMVKFAEYENQNNPLWKSKPGVMIDKVAKSTALRLAYPEQLGSLYAPEEMGRDERELNAAPARTSAKEIAAEKARALPSPKPAQVVEAPRPKARIVDVPDGQTEEQAKAAVSSRSEEDAPPHDETTGEVVDAKPSPVVPFGKNAGQPLSSLSDKQLGWYYERAAAKIAEGDERDRAWFDALEAEKAERAMAQ